MSWSWKKRGAAERTSSLDNGTGTEKESRIADDAAARDERIKELNSRLARALADAAAAKQHAKVAEEAVSGWERAGAEAEASKQQLAEVLKEKAVLQEKVAHLDGALKDCTRQVRLVREEQEQKRQELLQKKGKDMERLRAEYEARLADLGRQLLEASAENKAMAMTVQEHLQTIQELDDAKSRTQAENRMFQQHIQAMEKDKATLKYEVHLLNKEIQLRNEERQYGKRDIDAANKQHIEDTKKINRLEAECQKLRTLVRRKLPGPNTVAQMKMEADRPEVQLLVERLLCMEEETKMLRETLAQRNDELNKADSKLTAMEAYFSSAAAAKAKKDDHEEVNCSDAWASALVAELSQFKKDKLMLPPATNGFHSPMATSMMDDFAEMERLASSDVSGTETPLSVHAQKKDEKGSPADTAARKKLDPVFAAAQEADSYTTMGLVDKAVLLVQELAKAAGLEPEKHTPEFQSSVERLRASGPAESAEQVLELIKQLLGALNSLISAAFPDSRVERDAQTVDESASVADKLLELEMMRIEKNALETHLKSELSKMTSMDKELTNLRTQKESLHAAIESGHAQLADAQKLIDELKARLEDNKEEAMVIREVETQAQSANGVQDVVSKLEKELEEEEHENNQEEATEQEETQEEGSKLQKEQDIADAGEKLAECQRTILALGEQLKALSGSGDALSSVSSALSLARNHSDAESAAEQNNRALVVYSPSRSPLPDQHEEKRSNNGKMFEELGLNTPSDLSPLGSPLTSKKNKQRSSISRFFSRGKGTP